MKDTKYYICKYCYKEFEPKRRRVQKYCSNTCRSKDFHARKTNSSTILAKETLPGTTEQPKASDKINLAGIGNAAAGSILAEKLMTFLTPEDKKPATKGDIKKLIETLGYRYLPIQNLTPNSRGEIPYYDVLNSCLVYLSNADNTYH